MFSVLLSRSIVRNIVFMFVVINEATIIVCNNIEDIGYAEKERSDRERYCNIPSCGKKAHILCEKHQITNIQQIGHCVSKGLIMNQQLEAVEERLIVDTHNRLRAAVALGNVICDGKISMQRASNMMKMVYDTELSIIAQLWIYQCNKSYRPCLDTGAFRTSINGIFNGTTEESNIDTLNTVLHRWVNECKNFKDDATSYTGSKGSNNFIQMVWANSSRIGCGRAVYRTSTKAPQGHYDSTKVASILEEEEVLEGVKTRYWLLCLYGPRGRVIGSPIYEPGLPCSNCPPQHTCYHGMCTKNVALMLNSTVLMVFVGSWLMLLLLLKIYERK